MKQPSAARRRRPPPFRFLDLPSELRLKIYEFALLVPYTIDLDPSNCITVAPRLRLFFVSRRIHDEAFRVFYGQNTFRVFPVHGRFYHTKKPLLARLPTRYRAVLTTLELRLGPGWHKPPKGWVVDGRLGLQDAVKLRLLKIFVECDPASHDVFEGFRISQDFYTDFSVRLLRGLIEMVPSLVEFQFDGYHSVARSSPLLNGLITQVKAHRKRITWGPERGWNDNAEPSSSLETVLANLHIA